ncbi:hypothetical protein D3C71_1969460 [compost metagenome]
MRALAPSTWLGSSPPPGIALSLALDLSPPAIATSSGVLKYSPIATRVSLLEEARIHMTRKNAIIAVMKSAKAIFHAPP